MKAYRVVSGSGDSGNSDSSMDFYLVFPKDRIKVFYSYYHVVVVAQGKEGKNGVSLINNISEFNRHDLESFGKLGELSIDQWHEYMKKIDTSRTYYAIEINADDDLAARLKEKINYNRTIKELDQDIKDLAFDKVEI